MFHVTWLWLCQCSACASRSRLLRKWKGNTPHHYYVQYRAYIPADHLVTFLSCYVGQEKAGFVPSVIPLVKPSGYIEVLGDTSPFSTQYRIKEYVTLSTSSSGPASEPSVTKVPSISYNFQIPSTQGNITGDDFNPNTLLQCIHEQNVGSSDLRFVGGTTSSTAANQASLTFSGSGTDPLFAHPVAPIQFNLTVSINAKTKTATITGSHTCFPSHEIGIGNQVVYNKNPAFVNFGYLSFCLVTAPFGSETTVNCTVQLDGVDKCP